MRLIFFSFKHRHRQKELNNFLNNRIYGKYLVINLGGPFKYFFSKILIFLKIGKTISCDGRPIISDISRGINFWMRGTTLNIPNEFERLNNNFVTIDNPFIKNKKIFQIYPINIKKSPINNDLKIIYMSKIKNEINIEEKNIWEKNKQELLKNFSLVDSELFWEKIFTTNDDKIKKFDLYKKIKLLLRLEIIKNVKIIFDTKLNLIGDDWKMFYPSTASNYNIREVKKIYKGNICLDLGSMLGSSCLYSRSNQIIESGGLIIQSYQQDSKKIWGNLYNKILFNNLNDLLNLIEKLLNDKEYCSLLLNEIRSNFLHSKKSIEKSLDKIFL